MNLITGVLLANGFFLAILLLVLLLFLYKNTETENSSSDKEDIDKIKKQISPQ